MSYILFEAHDLWGCLVSLRDTFGPDMAEKAFLLFAKELGWLEGEDILELDLPKKTKGPFIAIIKGEEDAFRRLEFMAEPMHGYGKKPSWIGHREVKDLISKNDGTSISSSDKERFKTKIDRTLAKKYGHESVSIGESGKYTSSSGVTVDIKVSLSEAVEKTVSYPQESKLPESSIGKHCTNIEVTNETTLSAAKRLIGYGAKTAVLNFASATSPGGGFLEGARAQEEYLARSSCLYQCLTDNPMYQYHRENYNPFYTDFVIYSPNVPVIRADDGRLLETPYLVGIITAAAVHANRVEQTHRERIASVMWNRILRVLAVGVAHGNENMVLGAWGCGAFGNDGKVIAELFRKSLDENFRGAFKHVVFAIVDWSHEKRFIGPFEDVFKNN